MPVERADPDTRAAGYVQLGVNVDDLENARSFGGWQADIPALRALHPGLMDFDTWLGREGAAKFAAMFAEPLLR